MVLFQPYRFSIHRIASTSVTFPQDTVEWSKDAHAAASYEGAIQ
jgi:hypothetical protein